MMNKRKSKGSAILVVMLLLIIASIATQMTRAEQNKREHALVAMSWSNALQQVCASADTYATRNWATVSAQPTTLITMANLTGVPPLTSDVVATLADITVSASVTMSPLGCDAANNQCRSDVRVWTGSLPGSLADRNQLSNAVVKRIGDLASLSQEANPTQFVSRKSTRVDPNPGGAAGAVLVRCGEANIASSDTGLRGNVKMTGALDVGGNDLKFPDLDTGVAQITVTADAACAEPNRLALDATGRYMYCNGSTWQSAALPVTQIETTNVYH